MKNLKNFKIFENSSNFQIEVFNNSENLAKRIWDENGELIDPTIFDRIRYFSYNDFSYMQKDVNAFFVVMFDDDKVIGVAKVGYYSMNAKSENNYSISFLSIDKDYRKMGLARLMCDRLFKTAKEKGYDISTSSYTFIGKKFLQHLFNEYSKKYDVKFYDKTEEDSLIDTEDSYIPYKDTLINKHEI